MKKPLCVHFAIFLNLFGEICAQIPFLGFCPDYPVLKNFDVQKYSGKWHEVEKYFAIFELGGTCITATYKDNKDGTVGVFNSQIQSASRRERAITGTARLLSNDGSAKLGVTFPSVPFAGEANYWVLSSDYDNYSIVWSCTNFGLMNFQIVWFLARERNPSDSIRNEVYSILDSLNIRTSLLQKTEQSSCPTPQINETLTTPKL